MPANLLYREAPERAAQKAQDGIDASDKSAKAVSAKTFFWKPLFLGKRPKHLDSFHLFLDLITERKSKVRFK